MKLTDEERAIVVSLQMEKAHRFLEQADEMCKQQYWDIASNRYYYACYHAVQALLIKNGLVAHTHDGLLTQFGLHFVKAGKVDTKLGAFLSRMEQLREKGDYNCYYAITEDEIETIIGPTKELIEKVEELLKE